MRIYYYFLFRIYLFYSQVLKEKDIPLFFTTTASTTLVYFILLSSYMYLLCIYEMVDFINTYYKLLVFFLLWIVNYFLIVRPHYFLKKGFKSTRLGGVIVILSIIGIGFYAILAANCYRNTKLGI